jgi:hypothetical protein
MTAPDLRHGAPRRWDSELDGIRWLPRLIDKARAAQAGTLGTYLYGQSPLDRSLLRALGSRYRDFSEIIASTSTDSDVLAALIARNPNAVESGRAWSATLHRRQRLFLFVLDVDDGRISGPLRHLKGPSNVLSDALTWTVKRVWPAKAPNPKAP